jgi:hypothetical protein
LVSNRKDGTLPLGKQQVSAERAPVWIDDAVGTIALWYLPETFLGRYRKACADNRDAP